MFILTRFHDRDKKHRTKRKTTQCPIVALEMVRRRARFVHSDSNNSPYAVCGIDWSVMYMFQCGRVKERNGKLILICIVMESINLPTKWYSFPIKYSIWIREYVAFAGEMVFVKSMHLSAVTGATIIVIALIC